MTVQLIQFCPSLHLLQSFFQSIACMYLTKRWMAITVSIYRKTFLQSVDPKQPKNIKFSLWSVCWPISDCNVHCQCSLSAIDSHIKSSYNHGRILRGGVHLPWDCFAPPLRIFAPPLKIHAPPLGKVSMTGAKIMNCLYTVVWQEFDTCYIQYPCAIS
jgi:hypothetical protein